MNFPRRTHEILNDGFIPAQVDDTLLRNRKKFLLYFRKVI